MIHLALLIVATVIVIAAACVAVAFIGAAMTVAGELIHAGIDRICDGIAWLFKRRPRS